MLAIILFVNNSLFRIKTFKKNKKNYKNYY